MSISSRAINGCLFCLYRSSIIRYSNDVCRRYFPLRLSALTYKVPEDAGIAPSELKGKIVRAPLMNRRHLGVIVDVRETADPATRGIKEILSIHETFASVAFLQFLKWLSEYYITPIGLALKSSFFQEAVADMTETKRRERKKKDSGPCERPSFEVDAPFSRIHCGAGD